MGNRQFGKVGSAAKLGPTSQTELLVQDPAAQPHTHLPANVPERQMLAPAPGGLTPTKESRLEFPAPGYWRDLQSKLAKISHSPLSHSLSVK